MRKNNYIVILVGVCGTGKSALGQNIAQKLDVPFFDADKLGASAEQIENRLPQEIDLEKWLTSVEELIIEQSHKKGGVISCSLLKKEQRKLLNANIDYQLDWVFMKNSFENVVERVELIGGHKRAVSLLKSDFETLESPKRALTIDMTNTEQEIVDTILKYLARKYG